MHLFLGSRLSSHLLFILIDVLLSLVLGAIAPIFVSWRLSEFGHILIMMSLLFHVSIIMMFSLGFRRVRLVGFTLGLFLSQSLFHWLKPVGFSIGTTRVVGVTRDGWTSRFNHLKLMLVGTAGLDELESVHLLEGAVGKKCANDPSSFHFNFIQYLIKSLQNLG